MKTMMFAAAVSMSLFTQSHAAPELPKEVAQLQRLVGEWSSQGGTATMGGKQTKLDIKVSCAVTGNKIGVLCTSRISIEGLGTVEGTDLFGYDPGSKTFHWFCVNGLGEAHDHVSKVAPKAFQWVHEGLNPEGKPSKEVITMNLDDAGKKMEFMNDISVGGQPFLKMATTMIKK